MQSQIDSRIAALKEISQRKLTDILDHIPGPKDLVVDPAVMKALDKISTISVLRSHGVNKIYKLDNNAVSSDQCVYLILSDLITSKRVIDQINAGLTQGKGVSYHLILVPRRLAAIDQLIEEEGLWGKVQLHVFPWELIQLDIGLISLEMPVIFHQLFVDNDQALLPSVAQSLWSLQMLFGRAHVTLSLGRFAKQVQSQTELLFDRLGEPDRPQTDIGCVILMDRDVDYAATLLTPATYTSLLDEVLGIRTGVVEIPQTDKASGKKTSIGCCLSSQDEIYNQIKNRHFSDVFSFLTAKAKHLTGELDRIKKMAVREMKQYVSTQLETLLGLRRSLALHIAGCEAVITDLGERFERLQSVEQNMLEGSNRRSNINYIEEILATGRGGKLTILRLMCLLSFTQDGLYSEEAWSLKTQFLHAYGYQLLPGISNLERLGLYSGTSSGTSSNLSGGLSSSTVADATGRIANKVAQVVSLPKRSAFQVLAQRLKLFPVSNENLDLKQPTDMSYVFSGAYIPVACQIVQMLIKKETSFDQIVNRLLPGSSVSPAKAPSEILPRTFLVYFIGGVTYAEVAAFQLLEKLTGTRIIVAGTSLVNGNTLVGSAL